MATRQELERQLVAAHRSGNVQAAQQAAYAIRQYDQNALSAQVPQVNAPPPIERVPQPTFGSRFEGFSRGMGRGITSQLQGIEQIVTQPVETAKALYGAAEAAVRNPSQALGELFAYGKRTVQQATSGPEGFGQVLGENMRLVPGGRRTPTQAELDVYHGTPYTFEPEEGAPLGRFRSQKIGTGEGAQAYGYGLYLAESPETAKGYAVTLANRDATNQMRLNAHANAQRLASLAGDAKYAADDIRYALEVNPDHPQKELLTDTLRFLESGNYKKPLADTGNVYKVDLPDAKIEQMLDWDKPLSEQPKAVQQITQKLRQLPGDPYNLERYFNPKNPNKGPLGQDIYRAIAEYFEKDDSAWQALGKTPRDVTNIYDAASQYAAQLGIPGIKYLDAGSRDGGKGTRNFVVFPGEEQNLTILERK